MIKAHLISDKVSSNDSEAYALFEKSRFGEKSGQKIIYSLSESYFLVEEKKLTVLDKNEKIIDEKTLLKKLSKIDKRFYTKYLVYKDLRNAGHIPKTALKFGADFRVYEKGKTISSDHAKWTCFAVSENDSATWQDFAAKNRVAHSTKKNLLIAIVDEEDNVSYFEIKWTKI